MTLREKAREIVKDIDTIELLSTSGDRTEKHEELRNFLLRLASFTAELAAEVDSLKRQQASS